MNWLEKIKQVHAKRDEHQSKAIRLCEANGHILFPFDPMFKSRCRKCGQTVECNNVLVQTSAPDFSGPAVINKCHVDLQGGKFGLFNQPVATNTVI